MVLDINQHYVQSNQARKNSPGKEEKERIQISKKCNAKQINLIYLIIILCLN